jgi:hypothetical protein
MKVRRVATVAIVALLAAGSYAPAMAHPKKKPITKSYDLNLLPLWESPTEACSTATTGGALVGVSIDIQTIKPTGPGLLAVKVDGYQGDWDISVRDADGAEIGRGSGNDTPNAGPGAESFEMKFKKPEPLQIAICNFSGTPQAHASFTYTYK